MTHYLGHRKRLKERFIETEGEGLADYELLELVLFYAIPRVDVKPIAKELLQRFGSLSGVINASLSELQKISYVGESVVVLLKAIKTSSERLAKYEIQNKQIFQSSESVVKYCQLKIAHQQNEHFLILFLDRKNKLIMDEILQKGTIDHAPVYPREIVKRALELGASSIIMVHNHPSGDPTPSQADIEMTRYIMSIADKINLHVLDHIIIGKSSYISMKDYGLI